MAVHFVKRQFAARLINLITSEYGVQWHRLARALYGLWQLIRTNPVSGMAGSFDERLDRSLSSTFHLSSTRFTSTQFTSTRFTSAFLRSDVVLFHTKLHPHTMWRFPLLIFTFLPCTTFAVPISLTCPICPFDTHVEKSIQRFARDQIIECQLDAIPNCSRAAGSNPRIQIFQSLTDLCSNYDDGFGVACNAIEGMYIRRSPRGLNIGSHDNTRLMHFCGEVFQMSRWGELSIREQ